MRSTAQPLHLFCLARDGGWGLREEKNKARSEHGAVSSTESLASTRYFHIGSLWKVVVFFGLLLFFKSKTTEISLNSVSPTKGLGQFVTFLTIPPFTGKNNTFILGCLGGADGRNYSKLLFTDTHPLAWGHIRRAHFRNFNNADFPMRSQIPALHSQIGLQERRLSFSLLNYPFEPSNEGWVQPIVKTEPGYTVKLFVCLFGVGWSLK